MGKEGEKGGRHKSRLVGSARIDLAIGEYAQGKRKERGKKGKKGREAVHAKLTLICTLLT